MSLSEKYAGLVTLARTLGGKEISSREEEGKFKLWVLLPAQVEHDALWEAIRKHDAWEAEVEADLRVEKTETYSLPIPALIQPDQKRSESKG
jgi:hypothetical protein